MHFVIHFHERIKFILIRHILLLFFHQVLFLSMLYLELTVECCIIEVGL